MTLKTYNLPTDNTTIPNNVSLYIRTEHRRYRLGYSSGDDNVTYIHLFTPRDIPVGFHSAMLGLYATEDGNFWPFDDPGSFTCLFMEVGGDQ
jgi:hypothetical protein